MTQPINLKHPTLLFGIPILLLGGLTLLMVRASFPKEDTMYLAITADLLLTVPIVYYLLIRKTAIPKITVIPLLIIGLLLGTFLLPAEGQGYLSLFKSWVLPFIEFGVVVFILFKVRKGVKNYKNIHSSSPDFFSALRQACSEILPQKLVSPFATEVAVFYHGFFKWKKRITAKNEFTYHKESGTPALLGALILIIAVETLALHFLLVGWSPVVAWILSTLSVYTGLQIFGIAKSLGQRPLSITEKTLSLRYGIMSEADIPFEKIESVEIYHKSIDKKSGIWLLSPLGELESHNLLLRLKEDHELVGMYGFKRTFTALAFHLDKPNDFLGTLNLLIIK